jgi:enoyl-CoA hydratase
VIVIHGNAQDFAAGVDIGEMAEETAEETPIPIVLKDQFAVLGRMMNITKPVIGAVSGFVLGGGCELMMNCDLVIASETAKIGQPEVNLGVIPGAGGTQRLTKAVGKEKAMEMLLSSESISADEALRPGLVNKVVPVEVYFVEVLKLAKNCCQGSSCCSYDQKIGN